MVAALPLLLFQDLVWPADHSGCIKAVQAQQEDTVTSRKYLDGDISFLASLHLQELTQRPAGKKDSIVT